MSLCDGFVQKYSSPLHKIRKIVIHSIYSSVSEKLKPFWLILRKQLTLDQIWKISMFAANENKTPSKQLSKVTIQLLVISGMGLGFILCIARPTNN